MKDVVSCETCTTHEARALAVAAFCDPRSVIIYLKGGKMRATLAARIEAALVAAGKSALVQTKAA